MQLLTKADAKRIPALHSQEGEKNPIVQIKFFCPWSDWTWCVTEGSAILIDGTDMDLKGDFEDVLFFGFVEGHEHEMGYFSLSELQSLERNGMKLVERDMHFTPKPLEEARSR